MFKLVHFKAYLTTGIDIYWWRPRRAVRILLDAFLFYASFTLLCFFTNLIMNLPVNGIMNVSLDMSADGYNDTKNFDVKRF